MNHERMRRKRFRMRWKGLLWLTVVVWATPLRGSIRVVERAQADSMRTLQVVYHNRVCPLNTPATQFVKQLTGNRKWKGLTAEQVMLSWALYPEDWKDAQMIRISDPAVTKMLGIEGEEARFSDFFDQQGNYRLPEGKFPDIDQRLTLVALLTKGELYRPLSPNDEQLSDLRLYIELFLNTIPWDILPLCLCMVLTLMLFLPRCKRWATPIIAADILMLVLHLTCHT